MVEFSNELRQKAETDYQLAKQYFGAKAEEIETALAACSDEQAICMKFLYGSMPISDIVNYDFPIFLNFVNHGLFLRENMIWGKSIPEDIFMSHVLFYRINNEDIEPCRRVFYDLTYPRLQKFLAENKAAEPSMAGAALELNYWCFENATYQQTDDRTANPLTVLRSAYGRCGEESTFAVTAFRSVGIPARQIYTPRWAHCDDNHAWVEVWCDGTWHYLGACEPEPVLDKGWFTAAASRAMVIHSRMFSDYVHGEEVISREGLTTLCNALSRYTDAGTATFSVTENGQPAANVTLRLELLNYSEFFPISTLVTGKDGKASANLGLGDIHIHAVRDGRFVTTIADLRESTEINIDFAAASATQPDCTDGFDFKLTPPKDNLQYAITLTEEQKAKQKIRFETSAALRKEKESHYFTPETATAAANKLGFKEPELEMFSKALVDAKGNFEEIEAFLAAGKNDADRALRTKLLNSLTVKDKLDLKAAVLESHMETENNGLPEEIFIAYVLSPRLDKERLCAWRDEIKAFFSTSDKLEFAKNPESLWDWIDKKFSFEKSREYGSLIANPAQILKGSHGSPLSKKAFFVAVCRTLGIPARINPEDGEAQYYSNSDFHNAVTTRQGAKEATANLTINSGDGTKWDYFANWSLAILKSGVYQTLDFSERKWEGKALQMEAAPGHYRLITAKRMPNGSLFSKEYRFTLAEGRGTEVTICLRDSKISDMLENMEIPPFFLQDEDSKPVSAAKLTEGKKNIFFWLEEGKEPTEHILNELIDLHTEFSALDAQLIFVLSGKAALENLTLGKAVKLLPKAKIFYDDFKENVSSIARRMYVDPDKLPLIVVTNAGLNGVYAFSGYNVGQGDLLLKILSE